MSVIEIKNLTKSYRKARGIVDVNLEVSEGEIFGFIGPNGAGKSTTIRTLLGLIYPFSGRATVFGKNCIEHPEVKKEIGYLPSEVFYYDNMKVIDLLNYSAGFYKKDCRKRMIELAEIMDLDLKKKIEDLSFGNKKKVGIIQGLLHEPKLIILDEPTGGLDPLMQHKFFELIRTENRKGAAVFFSSHILSEVQRMCSRVAFIKEGKIIKTEKMSDLRESNYKMIKIEAEQLPDRSFFALPGVSKLEHKGTSISFLFKGDINKVLRKLAEITISNLMIVEPELEDIFLHYYTKENQAL